MASSIPSQSRVVDPFSSYNSNTVNQLTKMITRGNDGLTSLNDLQVSASGSFPLTQATLSIGSIFKDDVYITINIPHTIDFEDENHYVSFASGFNESGIYYIVLDYTYQKSRPAPQATIKILKPSQRSILSTSSALFFLKAINVIYVDPSFQIDSFYDYDPTNPAVTREYTPLYFGVERVLPSHTPIRDQGRVVYESSSDTFWFGRETGWFSLEGGASGGNVIVSSVNINEPGVAQGSLVYVDNNNNAQLAIATSAYTKAELGVVNLGSADPGNGRAMITGVLEDVQVETGYQVGVGDPVYLSETEAGKVTPVKPQTNIQNVGRALTSGNDSSPITIIFLPRALISTSIKGTIELSDWVADLGLYRYDVNIAALDSTEAAIVTSFFTDNTGVMELFAPMSVQLIDTGVGSYNIMRVWMNTNTKEVLYNVSSGTGLAAGGGGGSGTTNHALLSNLSYAASGHTGFAPNPHTNAMHSDPPSIPTNEIILFEKNTAVFGYTLLTTDDDSLVYITRGSSAGGETGGTSKSGGTWSQPNHMHPISSDGDHEHTTQSHALTVGEMPSHRHSKTYSKGYADNGTGWDGYFVSPTDYDGASDGSEVGYDDYVGGGTAHNHGNTGTEGDHDHGGTSGGGATLNTWRPKGRNFTRQQKL